MSDLDALLAGIVGDPHNALRWLVMADWLEDNGQPERAELVRVHRELLRTCTDPHAHPERPELHARMMELMRSGVQPCIPEKTLTLPGGVELTMSFIPPGSFLMGSPETENYRRTDETLHEVTLTKGFWLGVAPVTQLQWWAVTGENPSHNASADYSYYVERGGDGSPFFSRWPVEQVRWDDIQAFCVGIGRSMGLGFRLPTEAEWEYAARSGTTTPFHWGVELDGTQANCDGTLPYHRHFPSTVVPGPQLGQTCGVGRYRDESPHPWCLVDMIGNVWEWCSDWYDSYPLVRVVNPSGPATGTTRVNRGGGWRTAGNDCRAAFRSHSWPRDRDSTLGFRIAADLE